LRKGKCELDPGFIEQLQHSGQFGCVRRTASTHRIESQETATKPDPQGHWAGMVAMAVSVSPIFATRTAHTSRVLMKTPMDWLATISRMGQATETGKTQSEESSSITSTIDQESGWDTEPQPRCS